MSGHNKAFQLGQQQQGVEFDGKFLHFDNGVPVDGIKGFGKGALAIDSANGAVYMNQGSGSGATWKNVSLSNGYMSDPQGVASLMYSGKARIQIFGDSVHDANNAYNSSSNSGFTAFTSAYMSKWKPNKWAGTGVPMTTGSSESGAKQNSLPGSNTAKTIGAKPGTYDHYALTQASTVVTNLASLESGVQTAYSGSNTNDRIAEPALMTGKANSGDYWVGRGQTFANGSATNSTCWFNTTGQQLTYVHAIYKPSSGGGTSVVFQAKNLKDSIGTSGIQTLSASDDWDVITQTAPAPNTNAVTLAFGLDVRGNSTGGTFYNTHSRIHNANINDGMEINYMGSGGWSYQQHGVSNPSDSAAVDGIANPWYSDAAQQRVFIDFQTNIAYSMIFNGTPATDSTYLPQHLNRIRSNFNAANNGEELKIVVLSPYATGLNGQSRADNLAKICNSENVSFLNFHQKLVDSGVDLTDSTVRSEKLSDGVHPKTAFAEECATLIWDVISDSSS